MRKTILAATLAAVILPLATEAQNPNRPPGGRRGMQQGPGDTLPRRNRAALEGQLQQRMAQRMQNVLGLSDEQMNKLRDINGRYIARRLLLNQQERDIRMALNDEQITADSSRQKQVADLLDRMIKAQRQRIDILEAEQKDLATILTPLQRATYLGIEEQMRRQMEQLRQGGGRMGPPDGQPQGPPPDGMGGPGGRQGRGFRRPPDGQGPPAGPIPPGPP